MGCLLIGDYNDSVILWQKTHRYTTNCKTITVQNHLEKNILTISLYPIGQMMPNLHKSKMAATFTDTIHFDYSRAMEKH